MGGARSRRFMTAARQEAYAVRSRGAAAADSGSHQETEGQAPVPPLAPAWRSTDRVVAAEIAPVRKAAIVLVSLEQSVASQLLSHLDRAAVEAVTWEIARLERVDPAERTDVLEEFYGLGLRRL